MKKFFSEKFSKLPESGIRKVNEKALALERAGETVYHFELGTPDFDTPEYIKEVCKDSLDRGEVFYTSNFGDMELRTAIANKLNRQNHLNYTPEETIVTVGLSEAIFDILTAILEEGDEILLPSPAFLTYMNIPILLGAVPKFYELYEEEEYQPHFEEIRDAITDRTKAIVLISPNNPTGSILNRSSLEEIAKIAKEKDILVISDEVYERIIYDGEEHVSIASLPGMKERTMTLNGFSKAYSMTGWRVGYVAAPVEIVNAINKVHQNNVACASSFVQKAATIALTRENGEVEKMVAEYKRRRDYLYDTLNSMKGISVVKPKGAFYLFINVEQTKMTAEEFCDYMIEHAHVALVPGETFGPSGAGHVRMSYATSYDNIVAACEKMKEALDAYYEQQN